MSRLARLLRSCTIRAAGQYFRRAVEDSVQAWAVLRAVYDVNVADRTLLLRYRLSRSSVREGGRWKQCYCFCNGGQTEQAGQNANHVNTPDSKLSETICRSNSNVFNDCLPHGAIPGRRNVPVNPPRSASADDTLRSRRSRCTHAGRNMPRKRPDIRVCERVNYREPRSFRLSCRATSMHLSA